MTVQHLIGTGWAFPTGITASGGVRMVTGHAEIEGAIRMILSTRIGERVMRPHFGCAIWDHVFAPMNANTLGAVEKAVRDALAWWEPRIELESVITRPIPDRGMIAITINYLVRATNDIRNLVYPFYVIPGEE